MEKYIEVSSFRERIIAALSDAQRKRLKDQRSDLIDEIFSLKKDMSKMKLKIKNSDPDESEEKYNKQDRIEIKKNSIKIVKLEEEKKAITLKLKG